MVTWEFYALELSRCIYMIEIGQLCSSSHVSRRSRNHFIDVNSGFELLMPNDKCQGAGVFLFSEEQ